MSEDQTRVSTTQRPRPSLGLRAVGLLVLVIGAIACFLWTSHVLANGPLWMLIPCGAAWAAHSLLVWLLWRSG